MTDIDSHICMDLQKFTMIMKTDSWIHVKFAEMLTNEKSCCSKMLHSRQGKSENVVTKFTFSFLNAF